MLHQARRVALTAAFLALGNSTAAAQTFFGPTAYSSTADSPFPIGSPSFVLEDFEDHVLDAPGVSSPWGYVTSTHFSGSSASLIDSVDGDDGVLGNGACASCDSYYGDAVASVNFQFHAATLNGLPRKVGLVWTDGGPNATVTFRAYDGNGVSLGTVVATAQGDNSYKGTTGEDRFYGVEYAAGIGSITISHTVGGIEVDHLQYELPCTAISASTYCTAKTNSLGCVPTIGIQGCPSMSSPTPCQVTGAQFLNHKNGLLFYGLQQNGMAFQGGHLCVKLPVARTVVQDSAGSASGTDCTGTYAYDFNALLQGGTDPSLIEGATIYTQWWARDPSDAFTTSLSRGLKFTIGP